jgi:5'-nucleotidase
MKGLSGGFAKAQTVFLEEKAVARMERSRVITLMAGDLLMGTPFSTVFKGELGANLMNKMAFNAMVVGNHEFDYGDANLINNVKGSMQFPLISGNIKNTKGEYVFQRSLEVDSLALKPKVVIIGLTTPETPIMSMPHNVQGLIFEDPVEVAKQLSRSLRSEDFVVALTHLGVKEDVRLAEACPLIDVIIGGHSHTALLEPLVVNNVIICQAGAYAEYVGKLKITVDNGKVTKYHGKLIRLTPDVAEDENIKSTIQEFSSRMDSALKEPIGRTDVFLQGGRSLVRSDLPSNLGRLVAYVMAENARAEVGLVNAGAIRSSIQEGAVTRENIYTALPFPNTIVKMAMRGSDIAAILQRSRDLDEGSGGKLQSFGIEYSDSSDRKIIRKIGTREFDPHSTYSLAINDFLAAGGDGYSAFQDLGKDAINSYDLISDLFIQFVLKNRVIDNELLHRVLGDSPKLSDK